MKWRHSILYLLIFCIVAGYFYYFEVVKNERKTAADKEAKRLFRVAGESLDAVELHPKGQKSIVLKKEDRWKILEPVRAEADRTAVDDLVSTLGKLESEREVIAAAQDLTPYGLADPSLKVRFHSQETWLELLVGDKNPAGSGYYVKKGDRPEVFLIAHSDWGPLSRGVNDLRRKQLFTFEAEKIVGLRLAWQDGSIVDVKKQDKPPGWEIAGEPRVSVKESKVQNAVEQVQWLRARDFPREGRWDLKAHGLDSPFLRVDLDLGEGRTVFLLVGQKDKEAKRVPAYSSELGAVAWIEASLLNELPKTPRDLEDRSVVGVKPDVVQKADLRLGDLHRQAVRMEDKWGLAREGKDPEALKEPWLVRSLLWDLNQLEYEQKAEPIPPLPQNPFGRIELWSSAQLLAVMSWNKDEAATESLQTVWVEKDGNLKALRMKNEDLEKIRKAVHRILSPSDTEASS